MPITFDEVRSEVAPAPRRRGHVHIDEMTTEVIPERRGGVHIDEMTTEVIPERRGGVHIGEITSEVIPAGAGATAGIKHRPADLDAIKDAVGHYGQ